MDDSQLPVFLGEEACMGWETRFPEHGNTAGRGFYRGSGLLEDMLAKQYAVRRAAVSKHIFHRETKIIENADNEARTIDARSASALVNPRNFEPSSRLGYDIRPTQVEHRDISTVRRFRERAVRRESCFDFRISDRFQTSYRNLERVRTGRLS